MRKITFVLMALAIGLSSCSEKKTEQQTEVRWATYNIRYANENDNPNWEQRRDGLCQLIDDLNLDVLGMQEVLHAQLEYINGKLPEYAYVGVGRNDGKTKGEYSPLFYRKEKFSALDSGTFWLCENPDSVGMKGWDASHTRIATWAKLQDKATGKVFMAVNTHFDHRGVEARKQSALLIIRKIKEIVGDKPAVLTGDFNITDESDAYATITTNEFVLLDAHKVAEEVEGPDYTFHNFNLAPMDERTKIDFVFVTPQIKVKRSEIIKEVPDAILSDHNPQVVDLSF